MLRFAAIDFETANRDRNSACAVGLVVVSGRRVVERFYHLIRPPTRKFEFTFLHGIGWQHVREAPTFAQLWPELERRLRAVDFVAAHNAGFDRGVLESCCTTYGFAPPRLPFVCTVQLARTVWGIYPTRLPDVCQRLSIPLHHHHAASDAEACARIVVAARATGWRR